MRQQLHTDGLLHRGDMACPAELADRVADGMGCEVIEVDGSVAWVPCRPSRGDLRSRGFVDEPSSMLDCPPEVCPHCGSECVQVLAQPMPRGLQWWVSLRCGSDGCRRERLLVLSDPEFERFDEIVVMARTEMTEDLTRLRDSDK